jgi:hypothetical protein
MIKLKHTSVHCQRLLTTKSGHLAPEFIDKQEKKINKK